MIMRRPVNIVVPAGDKNVVESCDEGTLFIRKFCRGYFLVSSQVVFRLTLEMLEYFCTNHGDQRAIFNLISS